MPHHMKENLFASFVGQTHHYKCHY